MRPHHRFCQDGFRVLPAPRGWTTASKPRVRSAFDLDDDSASLGLAMRVVGHFELDEAKVRMIATDVGRAVVT